VTHSLPPELMSPEEREARADELERRISREWVRFAITEGLLIWLPVFGLGALYAAGSIAYRAFVVSAVVLGSVTVPLTLYWVLVRIRPLGDERAAMRGEVDTTQS
jgi:hypothetical protein